MNQFKDKKPKRPRIPKWEKVKRHEKPKPDRIEKELFKEK
jgi:hypothetical protein